MNGPKPLLRQPRVSSRSYDRYIKLRRRKQELVTESSPCGAFTKRYWRDVESRPSKTEAFGQAVAALLAHQVEVRIAGE